jgi:N-hydroxyarylamine O-acetyltransferase
LAPLLDDARSNYLQRLGVEPEPPSPDALVRLHRAHVERVAYETVWIQMGEHRSIDPHASVDAIASGRGGYCFQLNGALALLLESLGYEITRHVGGVHGPGGPTDEEMGNHLVLMAHGLPSDDNPDGTWYVDVGLGDALYEPLPLQPQTVRQGPFALSLDHATGDVDDWHLDHDPAGSFTGMRWTTSPVTLDGFIGRHVHLSTSPESGFVRTLTVQRRDATGADVLRGLTLRRIGMDSYEREIASQSELTDALADIFGIRLDDRGDAPGGGTEDLWARVHAAHVEWDEAGRP